MNTSPQPETVAAYLTALRRALKGSSAGLISDALADCEEHLQNELAGNPESTEADVLAAVIETYGTPEEIAEEYRDMEAALQGPFPRPQETPSRNYGFFSVIGDPKAYGALVYMLLSLATGTFYFTWTVTGLSLTVGLFILIIGIPFALLFVGSVRVLGHVEGRIIEALLGVRMPRRLPAETTADESLFVRIKEALIDVRTWSTMFYLLLMLPLGTCYFAAAVVGIVLSLGTTGGALWSLATDRSMLTFTDVPWIDHLLHTAPGLIVAALVGILLFFVVLHIARGVGWLHGRIAELLLVRM